MVLVVNNVSSTKYNCLKIMVVSEKRCDFIVLNYKQ